MQSGVGPKMDKLRPVSNRKRPTRPPRMRTIPKTPKGPKLYRQVPGSDIMSGPGEPPPGFLTFTNSRSEWLIYWALAKVLSYPKDPRIGPFIGHPGLWSYQTPFDGGRAVRGGQVLDFLVESPTSLMGTVAIRIQTERYHVFTDHRKTAKEVILMTRVARHVRVADIFEQDFADGEQRKSGQAAILEVKKALFGARANDPLKAGTARRIRQW